MLPGTVLGWTGARDHLDPRPRSGRGRPGGGLGGGARDVLELWTHDGVRRPDAAESGGVDFRYQIQSSRRPSSLVELTINQKYTNLRERWGTTTASAKEHIRQFAANFEQRRTTTTSWICIQTAEVVGSIAIIEQDSISLTGSAWPRRRSYRPTAAPAFCGEVNLLNTLNLRLASPARGVQGLPDGRLRSKIA